MLIELPIANFGINMSTKEKDYLLHNTKRTASKRTSYKHGTFYFSIHLIFLTWGKVCLYVMLVALLPID
jgi:hypothetical protein